jgi:hypothetical protein
MNGTVSQGVYMAAIGRRTLLNDELIGREMAVEYLDCHSREQ